MTEPIDFEALFLEHLSDIERLLAGTTRVLGFRDGDAEEFVGWARERLWENDYGLLRKWRGQSTLTTYLGAVIINLGRDFRVKHWGRWRPSTAAAGLGAIGIRLEKLVYRDGWTLAQAGELLRSRGESDLSNRRLGEILGRIPRREPYRHTDDHSVPIETVPGDTDAEHLLVENQADAERRAIHALLIAAMARLDTLALVTIRMHFLQGRSLADVARVLQIPQKPLYRVKDNALELLRRELEAAGVTWERVHDVFGGALAEVADQRPGADLLVDVGNEKDPTTTSDNGHDCPSNQSYAAGSPNEVRAFVKSESPERLDT